MTARWRPALGALLTAWALAAATAAPARAGELFDEATLRFAGAVDLHDWQQLAVRHAGRLKTFDSFARGQLRSFYGKSTIDGTSPTFAFLELYLNTGAYLQRPVVQVRKRRLRDALSGLLPPAGRESLARSGRLAPIHLATLGALELLVTTGRAEHELLGAWRGSVLLDALHDLKGGLPVRSALAGLLARIDAFLALGSVRIIPASDGHYVDPAALSGPGATGLEAAEAEELRMRFCRLARLWQSRDAVRANELLGELCDALIRRGGQAYPSARRRELEILHNRVFGFSIAWVGYALAASLLLASAVRRGRGSLRTVGMVTFGLTTAFLAAGWCLRWYLSGRGWRMPPLTNQYETVVAAALAAALAAAALEAVLRKGIFALTGSVVATAALLAAFLQPAALGAEISVPAAILATPILGWHVATLVIAYAMIGMSLLVSLAYVGLWGFRARAHSLLGDLGRANVILTQLACWLLAIGVALGAYWGDRAWGRWWGWDPKETWGLMTFLVYVAIVHVRLVAPARRRGLWTAVLAIVGCAVMGFTWWGVNYLLAGLHSYA